MLGTGGNAATVVIILEFILAIYSVALVMSTKKKWLKIVHIVLTVFWIVLALLNIFL